MKGLVLDLSKILLEKLMDFSHLFFFLFILPTLSAAQSCSVSKCANSGSPIRFPFKISGQQPARCGYPGFNLGCNKAGMTTLHLSSGEFLVRQINYVTQQIQLYDPDNCLPRRLLQGFKFNLSDSPFVPVFGQNFTFLSCPSRLTTSRFAVLGCLSNSTNSVLATSSESFAKSMSASSSCKIITTLPVPVPRPVEPEGFSADLNGDIMLTWYKPDCYICESEGRLCGYKNDTDQEIGCFDNPTAGENEPFRVLRLICLVIVLPAVTCAAGFGCFICFANWGYRLANGRQNRVQQAQQINPRPDLEAGTPTHFNGLDESTIQSYQKVVLGESRRLPGPNGTTCPICLADYFTKDTVRCIPECKHCFHVECIDEWLRVNSSCPVCRNSPSPSPTHIAQIA